MSPRVPASTRILVAMLLAGSGWCGIELDRLRAELGWDRGTAAGQSTLAATAVASLGGLRAFALDLLWCQAFDQWARKEWHRSAATFELIEILSPHAPDAAIDHAWTTCYDIAGHAAARGDTPAALSWLERGLAGLARARLRHPDSAALAHAQSFITFDKGRQEPYRSALAARGIDPIERAGAFAREAVTIAPLEPMHWYWLSLACRHAATADEAAGRFGAATLAIAAARDALARACALLPPPRGDDPGLAFMHERTREVGQILDEAERRIQARQREESPR